MQKNIISTSGFGWSGSSAVRQYLLNVPGVKYHTEIPAFRGHNTRWRKGGYRRTSAYKEKARKILERYSDVTVFDNLVLAHYIEGINLCDNIKAVVVWRDPRSNWQAIKQECPKKTVKRIWGGNVKEFIRRYRWRQERYNANIDKVKCTVKKIRFEDFMLKQAVRDDVVRWCGFDPVKITRITYPCYPLKDSIYLLPQESERRLIEKELKEYLYEETAEISYT